jgi:hypothetical protein
MESDCADHRPGSISDPLDQKKQVASRPRSRNGRKKARCGMTIARLI